ncbi:MAG: adenosylcobinamide-GDP ribazoletransferase [Rhodococcus sp.]|nr:adenosylcobinamide-GDP ribazoletransferase [Rhodococcus sp. (in: high G+C Gram-positive bacteria)]
MAGIGYGVQLAFSWLTVLPVRGPDTVDRSAAARAIAAAPVTGAALGVGAAALLWLLTNAGLTPTIAGLLTVAAHALVTRGMHIDGLSDTFDGLGCYGSPERAREVMHSGGAGPFGVAALVVCLGLQALSLGVLAEADRWIAVAVAIFVGRVAVVIACRRGVPAATDQGFGALVAGTQTRWSIGLWCAAALFVAAAAATPVWYGPLATAVVLALAIPLVRHCARRFGGLNGDVLGATLELTVTALLVAMAATTP